MPVDVAKTAKLRRELEEAEQQYMLENGQRYEILCRLIPEEEF